ncbi:hypothetical protein DYBT9623_02951 [Dyadobacter sp. CECT 9623]|uniref:Uncharacterized protein n=1 Tax=Dyadobacter linearis TaxID=2823330 RepID=A0ABM8US78_9BACT|nr:hypothetical protein [Dyadobacter sp. CECT 9623]CAG5070211.1 hypothetical protein DYBT9623_02951 [Dyadobacter sp. CECT 9623]
MKQKRYSYSSEKFFTVYRFDSEGQKGAIRKLILFTETSVDNVYNLAFGDYDIQTGEIDDFAVTNDGDTAKVLATVAATVYEFIEKYPGAWVVATGSTPARTRLYRMSISKYLEEICEDFSIFGYNDREDWEKFVIGEEYGMFLLTRKGNEISI